MNFGFPCLGGCGQDGLVKRKRLIWICAVCAVMGGGVLTHFSSLREPQYDGRALSDWLTLYKKGSDSERRAAIDAVNHVGPRAVPWLVKWTAGKSKPQGKSWRYRYSSYVPDGVKKWYDDSEMQKELGAWRGRAGFEILREEGASGTEGLIRIMDTEQGRWSALAPIMLVGKPAIPLLIQTSTNRNAPSLRRVGAMIAICGLSRTNTVPGLRELLTDSISDECEVSVNAMHCMETLTFQGTNFTAATSAAVVAALDNPDIWVRKAATNALPRIDSQAAKRMLPEMVESAERSK